VDAQVKVSLKPSQWMIFIHIYHEKKLKYILLPFPFNTFPIHASSLYQRLLTATSTHKQMYPFVLLPPKLRVMKHNENAYWQ